MSLRRRRINVLALSFLLYCTTRKTFWLRAYEKNPTQAHSLVYPFSLALFSAALTIHIQPGSSHLSRLLYPSKARKDPSLYADLLLAVSEIAVKNIQLTTFKAYPFSLFFQTSQIYRRQNSPSILYPFFVQPWMFRIVLFSCLKTSTTLISFPANYRLK